MPEYKDILLEEQYRAIVKQNDKIARAAKSGMAEDYAKLLRQLKVMLSDAYEQYSVDGRLTYEQLARYKRIEKLKGMVDDAITTNSKPIWKKVKSTLEETAQYTFTQSLVDIGDVANANIGRELSGTEITEILSKPWEGITLQERIALRRTDLGVRLNARIVQAGQREDTYKDLMGDLRGIVTKDYAKNARLMEDMQLTIQSETQNLAMSEAKKEGSIEVIKTWVTAGDEKVRPAHRLLDGQTVAGDEEFVIPSGEYAGIRTMGPGLFGIPELDYGDRCWLLAGIRKKE